MKRVVAIAVAALLLVGLIILALPALIWPEEIKAAVSERVEEITGQPLEVRGAARFTVWPRPRIIVSNVVFAGAETADDMPLFRADRLSGAVRLAPLLFGRIELASVALERPRLRVHTDATGRSNWEIYDREAVDAVSIANPRIGTVTITRGRFEISNRQSGQYSVVRDIDGRVSWPRFVSAITVVGGGIVNAADVSLDVTLNRPIDLMFGGASEVTARYTGPSLEGSAEGEVGFDRRVHFTGTADLAIADLTAFSNWSGAGLPVRYLPNAVAASGNVALADGRFSITEAVFTLDGNVADGAVSITPAETGPMLEGSLAFDVLPLDPLIARLSTAPTDSAMDPMPAATESDAPDPEEETPAAGAAAAEVDADAPAETTLADDVAPLLAQKAQALVPSAVTADLRFSAGEVIIAGFQLADAAASLSLRDGRADLGIGHAAIGEGALSGSVTMTHGEDGIPALTIALSAEGVPIGTVLQQRFGYSWIEGNGRCAIDLTGRGLTGRTLLSDLKGSASLSISEGRLSIPPAMRIETPGVPGFVGDLVRDRLAADGAALQDVAFETRMVAENGALVLSDAVITAQDLQARASGTVSLVDGALDIGVDADPRDEAERPPGPGATVPLQIRGRIDQPLLRLNPRAARRLIAER